jgi:hypothetical protein
MPTRTSDPDDRQAAIERGTDSYDRYSHVKTETGEIIYDTECDDAWVQAEAAVRLDEWR